MDWDFEKSAKWHTGKAEFDALRKNPCYFNSAIQVEKESEKLRGIYCQTYLNTLFRMTLRGQENFKISIGV